MVGNARLQSIMRLLLCICALVFCTVAVKSGQDCHEKVTASPPPYQVKYYEQQLDHFNYATNTTWKQKYLESSVYWKNSGPLFFYTGNEGLIEEFYLNTGFLFMLAQEFNALIVFAEHRFYGASLPFGDQSFSTTNLGYLSAEQALADFAVFIENLKMVYPGISKVITFGGSYGGMLSAWLRMKYPNTVDGALAASAPIFYLTKSMSRTAFFQKVTEDFAAADKKCPDYVREGYSKIDSLAGLGESGLADLTQYFSLCDPLTKDKVHHLKGWVRNSFASLAMVDYPYPASFLAPLPAYPIRVSCQLIMGAKNPAVGLAQGAGLFYNGTTGNLTCFNIDEEFIECADATGCSTGNAAISWDYQSCTEMVLPAECNNKTDMFPPELYDPSSYCMGKYGVEVRDGWMDTQYWGKDLSTASNIIFSNGDLDPWSCGGVLPGFHVPKTITTILIEGGAHHLDLRFANPGDPKSVIAARAKERDIIQHWIKS